MRNFNRLRSIIYTCALTCLCWGAIVNGLSDKRLCADPKCEKPISQATALLNYPAGNVGLVSLKINSNVRVMSKSAGRDLSLWGVEVNGRRGYVPQNVIREFKILVPPKDLIYEVPVDAIPEKESPSATVAEAQSIPVLNASEGGGVKIELETTTTAPLDVQLNADASIIMGKDSKEQIETPSPVASPVQEKMEIIDGTQLPVAEIKSESINETESHVSVAKEVKTESQIPILPQLPPEKNNAIKADIQLPVVKEVDTEKQISFSTQMSPQKNDAIKAEIQPPLLNEAKIGEQIPISAQLYPEKNDATKAEIPLQLNEAKIGEQIPISAQLYPEKNDATKAEIPLQLNEANIEEQIPISVQLSPEKNDATKVEIQAPVVKEINVEEQIPASAQLSSKIKSVENAIITESADHIVKEVKTEPQITILEPLYPERKPERNDNAKAESRTESVEHAKNASQLVPNESIEAEGHTPNTELKDDSKSPNTVSKSIENKSDYGDDYDDKYDNKTNDISTGPLLMPKDETKHSKDLKLSLPETSSQEVKVSEIVKETTVKTEVVSEATETNDEKYIEVLENNKKHTLEPQTLAKSELDMSSNSSEASANNGKISTEKIQARQNEDMKDKGTIQEVEDQQDINTKELISSTVAPLPDETATKYEEIATNSRKNSGINTGNMQAEQDVKIKEKETIQAFENQQAPLPNDSEIKNIESTTEFTPIQENVLVNIGKSVTEPGFDYEPSDDDFDVTTTSAPKANIIENEIPTVPSATTLPLFQTPVLQQHSNDEAAQEKSGDVQNNERHKTEVERNKRANLPELQHRFEDKHADANVKAQSIDNKNIEHHEQINPNDYYQQRNEQDILNSKLPHDVTGYHNNYNQQQKLQQQEPETMYTTEGTTNLHEHDNIQAANSIEYNSPDFLTQNHVSSKQYTEHTTPIALPSTLPPETEVSKKENDLFATILGTVNNFLSNDKKEPVRAVNQNEELDRILFPERTANRNSPDSEYCDRLVSDCSSADSNIYGDTRSHSTETGCHCDRTMSLDNFVQILAGKVLEMSDILVCLFIAAAATLFFIFGYYCFCNSSREGALLSKLNLLERSLLATHKENAILKHEIMETRGKLSSIQDNSFGSNDMVIALKKELEEEILEKHKLQEQVGSLEKELENATEAGLELNKIVSELLSNQTGDESIISSVEELQRQLNEQQNTIYEINTNLAEKSRENSELQLMLAEQNARFGGEIASLQQDNDELEAEKTILQTRLDEIKNEFEEDITRALEGKNFEIRRLQLEITDLNVRCEHAHMKWQTSLAKIEALEECLKTVKRDPSVNIKEVIDVANVRADLIDLQKQRASLKERLDAEKDTTKMLDDQVKALSAEVEKLKHEFHQSEKDKLEAQTRLEVLSNYFKEKEMQLQKELSIKEVIWLKQQGETTSTVDRLTAMQEEIQSLKSQNDSLRAEIEAQLAAHKAQIGTLENRAHETWLAARQSERRCEEARAEATSLRRKLTALAGGSQNEANRLPNAGGDGKLISGELNNAPSPIHMESPGSPLLGRMPPPPFLPPPFLGPPPPFMGIPPPFMPPGEMRPPPLGRLMSPAPPSGGPPHLRSARYTPPDRGDYDDYDDDDDDLSPHRGRRRSIGGSDSWHRNSYSPPRTYRSHSPSDSRYNYTRERDLISTYDTETDISPPPSPRERRQRGGRAGSFKAYSPQPTASSPISESGRNGRKASANKGALSSGSEKSYSSSSRHGNKAKEKGKGMV